MFKSAIYISSDDRSGSTMLDLMLGNHDQITSLGEVQHINTYLTGDRKFYNPIHPLRCMCGQTLNDCEFWNKIQNQLPIPLSDLKLRLRQKYNKPIKTYYNAILTNLIYKVQALYPQLLNSKFGLSLCGYKKLAKDYFLFYSAAGNANNTPFVVDSGKNPDRIAFLHRFNPDRIKIILLYRDPRAVVYSKMKRGMNLNSASKFWRERNKLIELYSEKLPNTKVIRVKYEDICENTQTEMLRISTFLGIDYDPKMCELEKDGRHHIGGSPSKFNKEKTRILLDKKYLQKLTNNEVKQINAILADSASRLGYS